jgi:hypothetical protein
LCALVSPKPQIFSPKIETLSSSLANCFTPVE